MSNYKSKGYFELDELRSTPGMPSEARQRRGPVACIECAENIPCNPCEAACPHHAIIVGRPITNLPRLDESKCIGCGLCIPHCSGQAIFVIDKSKDEALISMPYEFLPLPREGDVLSACDRSGKIVAPARVVKCTVSPSFDKTAILKIAVPMEFGDNVRGVRRK